MDRPKFFKGEVASTPPEAREEKKEFALLDSAVSKASPEHPDRNEDKILGQIDDAVPDMYLDNTGLKDLLSIFTKIEKKYQDQLKDLNIYGLFDGVSTANGHLASRITSAILARRLSRLEIDSNEKETRLAMIQALEEAASYLYDLDIATTADVIRLLPNDDPEKRSTRVVFAHVGDSRIYKRRTDGSLERITVDHNVYHLTIDRLVREEVIDEKQAEIYRQARFSSEIDDSLQDLVDAFYRQHAITNCVGEGMRVTTGTFELEAGELVLMVSDGISDNLSDSDLSVILSRDLASGDEVGKLVVEEVLKKITNFENLRKEARRLRLKVSLKIKQWRTETDKNKQNELLNRGKQYSRELRRIDSLIEGIDAKGYDDMSIIVVGLKNN